MIYLYIKLIVPFTKQMYIDIDIELAERADIDRHTYKSENIASMT